MEQVCLFLCYTKNIECPAQLTSLYKSCLTDRVIVPKTASVRLTNKANEFINIHSILVFNGEGTNISAIGIPSMSSIHTGNASHHGPMHIISGRTRGFVAHTLAGANEWMEIKFSLVDTLSKIVINNIKFTETTFQQRIIGCTLRVTVGGISTFNRVITNADFYSQIDDALTFGQGASVRLTNKESSILNIHSMDIFNENGVRISAAGTPSMSSVYVEGPADGPSAIISGLTEGPLAQTNMGPVEWIDVSFSLVDSISKVVINNRECGIHNCDLRIIGTKLTITVGGVIKLNHIITQENYDARIGKALHFSFANVRLINSPNQILAIHSILVYNGKNT